MLPFQRFDGRLGDREVSTPAIIYREVLPSVSQAVLGLSVADDAGNQTATPTV